MSVSSDSSGDIFRAILAMDSYNRGYNAGLKIYDGNTTSGIGSATIGSDSTAVFGLASNGKGNDENASFYAIAYNWTAEPSGGSETLISYRGTDNPVADGPGISTGIGVYDNDQARLAAEFYRNINGNSTAANSNITLAGHSLGGGLAGFVGSIYGVDADYAVHRPANPAKPQPERQHQYV